MANIMKSSENFRWFTIKVSFSRIWRKKRLAFMGKSYVLWLLLPNQSNFQCLHSGQLEWIQFICQILIFIILILILEVVCSNLVSDLLFHFFTFYHISYQNIMNRYFYNYFHHLKKLLLHDEYKIVDEVWIKNSLVAVHKWRHIFRGREGGQEIVT